MKYSVTDIIRATTPVVAIIGVIVLSCVAMNNGINGIGLSLAVGAITGLGGYEIKVLKDKVTKKSE